VPGGCGEWDETWAAPGVRGSSQGAGPRGERLGRVRSAVWSGYGAGEGTWGSRSLGQGSKERVTSWSVTAKVLELHHGCHCCTANTAVQPGGTCRSNIRATARHTCLQTGAWATWTMVG
jgi:hypothetical protein